MLRKVINSLLVFIGIATYTLGMISPVSALEAGDIVLQLQPAQQEFHLVPGHRYGGAITVTNVGRLPFTFTVVARPYQVLNAEYDPDFSTENNYTRLSTWIDFGRSEYRLEPGASVDVEFMIAVPEDAPGGGQYAAIIVETKDSRDENATMKTITQVASILYGQVYGDERLSGELISQNLPNFLLSSPFSSTVTLRNDGNVDFRAEHTLTIHNFFTGREVFSPTVADGQSVGSADPIVLPDTTRVSRITWEGAPPLGIFRATSHISFLDQEYAKDSIVFLCPIWLVGLIVIFILLAIIWIILRLRRHKESHSQVV